MLTHVTPDSDMCSQLSCRLTELKITALLHLYGATTFWYGAVWCSNRCLKLHRHRHRNRHRLNSLDFIPLMKLIWGILRVTCQKDYWSRQSWVHLQHLQYTPPSLQLLGLNWPNTKCCNTTCGEGWIWAAIKLQESKYMLRASQELAGVVSGYLIWSHPKIHIDCLSQKYIKQACSNSNHKIE